MVRGTGPHDQMTVKHDHGARQVHSFGVRAEPARTDRVSYGVFRMLNRNLKSGTSQGRKWIHHPLNGGMPCREHRLVVGQGSIGVQRASQPTPTNPIDPHPTVSTLNNTLVRGASPLLAFVCLRPKKPEARPIMWSTQLQAPGWFQLAANR